MDEKPPEERSSRLTGDDDPTLVDRTAERLDCRNATPILPDDRGPGWLGNLYQELAKSGAERLRSQGVLASGGMGVIEVVVDGALERRLAMKVISERLRDKPAVLASFVREARITGQLDHPAVVPVHDLGVDAEGRLFFTMKIVDGKTLKSYLEDLSPDHLSGDALFDLLEMVIKVCDALAFAHSRGVVHCDVKPLNVMVGDFGQVYLMDWGIAQFVPGSEAARAEAGVKPTIGGTPSFMAPEQALQQPVDERTDIFGVGALLYFAVTKNPPYHSDSVHHTLDLARKGHFVPVAEAVDTERVPKRLQEIIERAMSPDKLDRQSSMAELRDDLAGFLRGSARFPERRVRTGEHILREGEPGHEVYFLMKGRAQAHRTFDGGKLPLGFIEPGEVIGEMAILTSSTRTASVIAIEDCRLMVVTEQALERELSGMPPWMAALTRALARRFREREEQSLDRLEQQRPK